MPAMTRVAALPVSALADLRFDKTWRLIGDVTATTRELDGAGHELADAFYDLIGDPSSAPVKSKLVAVRRALHSARRLPPHAWNDDVRASVPDDLMRRVDAWQRRHRLREELLAELPVVMAAERSEVDGRLREVLRDLPLRYGLVLGSPVLYEELRKWLTGPPDATPPRQPLLRLVKYLSRVVAKTSPYSTFTISGVGAFRTDVAEPLRPTGEFGWRSVAEVNVWIVARLALAASRHPAVVGRMRVRANPSILADGPGLRFLGPAPQSPMVSIRRTDAVGACLDIVGDRDTVTVDEVGAGLRALDGSLGAGEVRAFVLTLVDAGLLELLPPYDDRSADHLGDLLALLDRVPEHAELAARLRAVHDDLRAYPALTDPDDRLAHQRRIHGAIGEVLPDGLPRKNLFHENAVFSAPVAEFGTSAWMPVLADLRRMRGALALFDAAMPGRRALAQIFAAQYGTGGTARWLDFYQLVGRLIASGAARSIGGVDGATLGALCAGPLQMPAEQWRLLPFAREQCDAVDQVTAAVMAIGTDSDGAIRLSSRALAGIVDGCSSGPGIGDPLACYVQLRDGAAPARVVLNTVTIGYGRGRTRLARLLEQAGVAAEPVGADETGADGEVLLESHGLFGSNLNMRAPGTRYTLDFPSTTPGGDPDRRVPVNDLEVRHDPERGTLRLRSIRLGRPVRALHGGMMAEFWLPPPLRHLVEAYGPAPSLLHASVPPLLPREVDPRGGGIVVLPRVEIGLVTLQRRCWAFPAGELPKRRKGEPDHAFWLRMAAWLAGNGMPERFFARVIPARQDTFRLELKSRKPTYVDASIWHLVATLERSVADDGDLIVLTEALPDLSSAPRFGSVQRTTEVVLEVPGD